MKAVSYPQSYSRNSSQIAYGLHLAPFSDIFLVQILDYNALGYVHLSIRSCQQDRGEEQQSFPRMLPLTSPMP
jgi:hypothetical protein